MIQNLFLTPFSYQLKFTVSNGLSKIKTREGFFLHLLIDDITYKGEVAPFPEVNPETLDEVNEAFFKVQENLKNSSINLEKLDFEQPLFNLFTDQFDLQMPPTLLFGIESALFNFLISKHLNLFLNILKFEDNNINVQYNNLLYPNLELPKDLNKFTTSKIKIGRQNKKDEIQFINKIIKKHPNILLRLDGNQNLTETELLFFIENIENKNIEYFEDPLEDPNRIKTNNRLQNIKFAIDESFLDVFNLENIPQNIEKIIIKPTRFGVSKTIQLISKLNKIGKKVVISNPYLTKVGSAILIMLAHLQNNISEEVHGLDTLNYIVDSNLDIFIDIKNGEINLEL